MTAAWEAARTVGDVLFLLVAATAALAVGLGGGAWLLRYVARAAGFWWAFLEFTCDRARRRRARRARARRRGANA